MSELLALGVSHKTAAVALRERLAFTDSQAREFAQRATASPEVREAVVISTCNRTEVYLVVGDPVRAEADVLGLLARRASIRLTELAEVIYSPRNCDAARQLYRVTAGLDSMIVGEAEVQGQVRRAHEAAMQAGCTGPLSNRLFAAALSTGKRVRSETAIGASRVSVPSVAVDLALGIVGGLKDRHVVIVGAGETSELTARALASQGAGTIFVANRHADRALSLAERFGGSVVGLEGLPEQLVRADIVVSSTSSPHAIVGPEELEVVMRERAGAGSKAHQRSRRRRRSSTSASSPEGCCSRAASSRSPNSSRASSRLPWPRASERLRSRIVGSCSRRPMTALAIASTRARSRGEADSQPPAFSCRTASTIALPCSRRALTVGRASS